MKATDLINMASVSRLLTGHRSSLTRKRISEKHRKKLEKLISVVEQWRKEVENDKPL